MGQGYVFWQLWTRYQKLTKEYHLLWRRICGKYFLLIPLTRETDKIKNEQFFKTSILEWQDLQKSHMTLGNLAKLVVSILASQNWSFAKLLSFLLCHFLWWEVFLREQEKIFSTYSDPRNYIISATLVLSLNSHKKGLLK